MIQETYASKRPAQVYQPLATTSPYFTTKEIAQATARSITPAEYVRRNDIIKQLYTECPYDKDDIVYPANYSDYQKYGPVKIVGVCDDYSQFSFDTKWSKNDNPMIVTFVLLNDPDRTMFCTTNYLQQTIPTNEQEC
jgi:hypothetical protein